MGRWLSVAVVVLVVLAGCSGTPGDAATTADRGETPPATTVMVDQGPTGTTETPRPRTPTSDDRRIEVDGGTLPTDATVVFDRIEEVTGIDGRPPRRVVIEDPNELPNVDAPRSTLDRYLGFSAVESDLHGFATPTPEPGQVTLSANLTADRTEAVLAHELYHVIWFQEDFSVYGNRRNVTTQSVFLTVAIAEGAAVYVQQRYWERYMAPESFEPAATNRRRYHEGTPMRRTTRAAYYFGYRYLDQRLESPRDLSAVYEDPPRTTEELIHQLPPGSEPPTDLSVDARSGDGWSLDPRVEPDARQFDRYVSPDTRGELFVRHALQVGVNDTAAASAAAGWGNDALLAFQRSSDEARGFVWTLRFDDAANASEFESVFVDYLSNRGQRDGAVWTMQDVDGVAFRIVAVDDRTVTLVIGPRPFAANTSVAVSDGRVVAEVP